MDKGTGTEIKGGTAARRERRFEEGVDFYYENGLMVLTEKFLLDRGFCCGNGCRHCPYPESEIERKGREGR
ncbi:MAG: hypothetical protein J5I65_00100 [Aridibacter famidurans]|nr:hypothetical protein [Aridibacter famidurans]